MMEDTNMIDGLTAEEWVKKAFLLFGLNHRAEAIEAVSKAISIDSNHSIAYFHRAFYKSSLNDYKGVLLDLDAAIRLNPTSAEFYVQRGFFQVLYGDQKAGMLNYNRFWYFTDFNNFFKNLNNLFRFYTEYPAPFLIWHKLQEFINFEDLPLVNTIVDETRQQCRSMWYFLDFLTLQEAEKKHPSQFYYTEALINFYMGDPITAYKIYDEKIDDDEIGLNLMGQYYFLESAKLFLEPHDGILAFALGQIERETPELIEKQAWRELYYAGQILFNNGQTKEAHEYFQKADAYLPAAMMQVMMMLDLGMDAALIEQKKKEVRERDNTEGGYLKGFPKKYLQLNSDDYFETFHRYALYKELLEVITEIRDPTEPFEYNEMWDAFRWHENELQELAWMVRKEELSKVNKALLVQFEQNVKENFDSRKHEELYVLEDKLGKGILKLPNLVLFQHLKEWAGKGDDMELLLGDLITGQVFDANTNALLVEYFYLKGNIDIVGAYVLYFYIDHTTQTLNKPVQSIAGSLMPEMGKKIVELSLGSVSLVGQVLTAGTSQGLMDLLKGFITSEPDEDIISKSQKFSAYQQFIEGFLTFISYKRETLGELGFQQRFPLEGFEDWSREKK